MVPGLAPSECSATARSQLPEPGLLLMIGEEFLGRANRRVTLFGIHPQTVAKCLKSLRDQVRLVLLASQRADANPMLQ